jgi:hypothetical protein
MEYDCGMVGKGEISGYPSAAYSPGRYLISILRLTKEKV